MRWLLVTLRRGWWIVLLAIVGALIAAGVWLKVRPPVYTATMVVAPATRDLGAAGRLVGDLERYASLAALAQMPVSTPQAAPIDRYLELVVSVRLAERLAQDQELLRRLFPDHWDATAGRWRPPENLRARISRAVGDFFGLPGWTPPGADELAEVLAQAIGIESPERSALRQIMLQNRQRAFAVELLGRVHAGAEALLREDALTDVGRIVAQLEQAIRRSDDTRRARLDDVLGNYLETQVLLQAEVPFAAEVVSPPNAGVRPTSMSPLLVLALAGVVGVILGTFLVFLRDALRGPSG